MENLEFSPYWKPLEDLYARTNNPELNPDDFMCMGTVIDAKITLYKNIMNRHYINIDDKGKLYEYDSRSNKRDDYNEITLQQALKLLSH